MQRINDTIHNQHWIYLYDDDLPILLPNLYSRYTTLLGLSVELKSKRSLKTGLPEHFFEEREIGSDAQYVRGNQLGLFLEWVEENEHSLVTLTNHTALPSEYINEYINDHLIELMGKSELVVDRSVFTLTSYYNWLTYFFGNSYKKISIYSEYRELARANNKSNSVIKYHLPATRELLYRHANSLLEEIVLRNGGELGCRTMENQGFLLHDFEVNKKKHKGILSLFKELNGNPERQEFEYHLSSLYTKYKVSRFLYIPKSLLLLMKRYYETERPDSDSKHLLVSNSNNNSKGQVISKAYGTKIYSKIIGKVRVEMLNNPEAYSHCQALEDGLVYHNLRHSFGTDIFFEECQKAKKNYESITTESRVYIETARRLGHKVDGRYSNQTTKIYIHACGHRERLLKEVVNG
ncbi:site-specific integrase [Vibrio splendidus]|uniref:site-specific integrase n=1 Tax=Vibrio splendidus TaxID=29497 RepID=UPI000C84DDDC|nr:site-specific integrase [Vibrio splendidus]PMO94801.1 hypothetical protein BCS97_16190 [Vibrio splendidus]PMP23772.1 hypothetical protein BCS89_15630 [Vibrio splendidus]PMP37959.1 hypothetical protein BCS88_04870 [Vibrio splendidus]PMP39870.1 hypothetical protein BCS87_08985 [Vibrio splendidus]PMP48299.1 hypothetical protein BCS85_09685 [Vibrio splendidus]